MQCGVDLKINLEIFLKFCFMSCLRLHPRPTHEVVMETLIFAIGVTLVEKFQKSSTNIIISSSYFHIFADFQNVIEFLKCKEI